MTVIQEICLGECCLSRLQVDSLCKAGKSAVCQYHFHYCDMSLAVTASAEPDLSLTVFHHLSQRFPLPQHKFCSTSQIILAPLLCHIKSVDSLPVLVVSGGCDIFHSYSFCWSFPCMKSIFYSHHNQNQFSKKKKTELG